MEMKSFGLNETKLSFGLNETKLFHFHRILKNGGRGGGFKGTPSGSATGMWQFYVWPSFCVV